MRVSRMPWVALSLSLASAIFFAAPGISDALALRPGAVARGELWRLLTGHFVHFSGAHAVGDITAFAVWASALELWSRRALVVAVVGSAPFISFLMLLTCPALSQYRGLSALDCTLVAQILAIAWAEARAHGRWVLAAAIGGVGAALLAKTVYEFVAGQAILAPDLGHGVTLLPSAHAFGLLSGLVVRADEGAPEKWARNGIRERFHLYDYFRAPGRQVSSESAPSSMAIRRST